MASGLGISLRNFQRLEVGEVEPKLETLIRIAKFLDLPVSALIRTTDDQNLFIQEFSTNSERIQFKNLQNRNHYANEDLDFVRRLIMRDREITPGPGTGQEAEMKGTVLFMHSEFSRQMGFDCGQIDMQKYSLMGSPVERWEVVFRLNLKKIHIENAYNFPVGIKIFESYHFRIDPNPDNPMTHCYFRDVTERSNLTSWLKNKTII